MGIFRNFFWIPIELLGGKDRKNFNGKRLKNFVYSIVRVLKIVRSHNLRRLQNDAPLPFRNG